MIRIPTRLAQPQLLLLLLASHCGLAAAGKKRKQPAVPAELRDGCPFHRDDADAQELSEFGHEMERDGRQPEAERCYAQAIRTHPRTAVGWFDLAVARQYSHQAAALKYYRHGLSLLPSAYHYNQFGIIMRAREKHDEAAHLFRSAAKLQPSDADALFNLGGSHDIMERPQESLWAYRGALERERKNEARIQNNIGHQLGKLNRWRESMHAFREAEEADPDFPETHYNLAHILLSFKQLEEAEHHLRHSERLRFDDAKNVAMREQLAEAFVNRTKRERREKRISEQEKRDGHLTREERVQRMQDVIGQCGIDNKQCMRELLGQADGATEEDLVRF